MPGCDKTAAIPIAQRLRLALREETFLGGERLALRLTGSLGLASFPEDGDSVHAMLRAADAMMYEVKNTTRDDIAVQGRRRREGTMAASHASEAFGSPMVPSGLR